MSRFKINIHQMQEESAILKEKYDQYSQDQESLYKIAKTTDGSWNDNNTSVFINCIEHDEKDIIKFHNTFFRCMESIDTFTTNLDTLLGKNGIIDIKKDLSYDEDYCKKSATLLHSCIEELKSAKSKILGNYVGCNAARAIQMVSSNITSCMNSLEEIEKGMTNIQTGIENLIVTTSSTIKSYDTVVIADNDLKYNWTPVSYVKDYTDVFKKRTEELNSSEREVLNRRETAPDTVSSNATLSANSEQLKTMSHDASVSLENDASIENTTFHSKNNTEVSYSKNTNLQSTQSEMSVLNKEVSITNQEEYQTNSSNFVNTNSNSVVENPQSDYESGRESFHYENGMNLSNAKAEDYNSTDNHLNNGVNITISNINEDYSATKGSVGISSNLGSISGIKSEKFDTSTTTLNSVENSGIQLEKAEYTDSVTTLNRNQPMNLSLEKDNSFEG